MLTVCIQPQEESKVRFAPAPFGPIWEHILKESLGGLRTGPLPSLDKIIALSGQLMDASGNDYTVAMSAGRMWAGPAVWFGSMEAKGDLGRWIEGGDIPPGHFLPERFVLPAGRLPLTRQSVALLLSSLIPLEQALPIIPDLWCDCGLGRISIDQHFEKLLVLAQSDPDTADLIFRGELIEAEKRLLNTGWLGLVRRSAVLWLVGDLFRTGQLVRSIDDIAHRTVGLNRILLFQEQARNSRPAASRGSWLRVGSALGNLSEGFKSIERLIFYPEEGKRPKFREGDGFKALRDYLENSSIAKGIKEDLRSNGVHYRFRIGRIGNSLRFHSNYAEQLRKQPQKGRRKDKFKGTKSESSADPGLADKSCFEIIVGIQPIAAIAAVAILIGKALEILEKGSSDQSVTVLERVALTPWDCNSAPKVRTNFKLMIQLMRIHWWNYKMGKNCAVDWLHVNFNEAGAIRDARADVEVDTVFKNEIELARDFINSAEPVRDDALASHYDFPRARNFVDISMRYRN